MPHRTGTLSTAVAREAAARANRERAFDPVDARTPKVFAVRLPSPSVRFGWEVRRYGSFVLSRSEADYPTMAEAYAAGEAALSEVQE